ncbi:MAG: O-antigen ligase family protein, partial [Planctomycetota bacterium]
ATCRRRDQPAAMPPPKRRQRPRFGRSLSARRLLVTTVGIGMVLALITIGFLLLGDEEWMAAAPSSLLFRLRYWRSTLGLLGDHPWMGAGPGGFQSLYLKYRLPVSSETIADPHNFVFETLAAGGLVGGVLLGALIWVCRRAKPQENESQHEPENESTTVPALFIGATTTLAMIWLFALATGQLPDYEAHLFAVPLGVAGVWLIRSEVTSLSSSDVRTLALAIVGTMLIHLCFAGGWTVPGVGMWLWLAVALLCHPSETESPTGTDGEKAPANTEDVRPAALRVTLVTVLAGVALLICMRVASLGPTQASKLAQLRATDSLRRGLRSRAEEESQHAVAADAWAVDPALWRSQWRLGELLRTGRASDRESWLAAIREVADRAGENPLVIRALGEQSLHLYQCLGRQEDLAEGQRMLMRALAANPSDVSLIAELALVALERGDREHAIELARLAERISLLDNNVVQALGLQHVYAVEKIGVSAAQNPILRRVEPEFDRRIPEWRP